MAIIYFLKSCFEEQIFIPRKRRNCTKILSDEDDDNDILQICQNLCAELTQMVADEEEGYSSDTSLFKSFDPEEEKFFPKIPFIPKLIWTNIMNISSDEDEKPNIDFIRHPQTYQKQTEVIVITSDDEEI